jgi:hypothetical protein
MKHLILVWHAFQYRTVAHALALFTVVMDDRSQVRVGIKAVDEALVTAGVYLCSGTVI